MLLPAVLPVRNAERGPAITAAHTPALSCVLLLGLPLAVCLVALQALAFILKMHAGPALLHWFSRQEDPKPRRAQGLPIRAQPTRTPTKFLGSWSPFFNLGQRVLAIAAAGTVLHISGLVMYPAVGPENPLSVILLIGIATLALFAVNTGLIAIPLSVDLATSIRTTWWRSFRWSVPQLFWIPLGAFVLASLYSHGLWVPFLIVYASELCATRLGSAIMKLRALLEQSIEVLRTILLKTAPHLETETDRIRDLALKLADRLRLGPFERAALEKAIPLLNMGYVGVEKHLLLRKPTWNEGDREQMLRHPLRGARILSKAHHLKEAARLVAMHHERVDGSGYPRGLEGPDIPTGARILGTVEAYVGMTSERPHRRRLARPAAVRELLTSGHDRRVVEELARVEGLPFTAPPVLKPFEASRKRKSLWREKRRRLRELIYYPPPPEARPRLAPPRWVSNMLFLPAPIAFFFLYATSSTSLSRIDDLGALWLLIVVASAILAPVFLRRGATLSAVMGSLVAATLLLPPAQALVFCLAAGTVLGAWEVGRRRLPSSGPSLAAGVLSAAAVYQLLQSNAAGGALFHSPNGPVYLVPAVAAALAFGVSSTGTASILEGAVQKLSPARVLTGSYLAFLPETLLYLMGGIVMAAMYSLFGPAGAALALVYPLLDLHFDIWHQNQLQRSYTELLEAEAAAIDEKDSYTRGHSQRVSAYAVAVAREMGLSESHVNLIEEGGFEHDIGKIAWENGMLMRPDRLSTEEQELMRRHPADGAEIAQTMGAPRPVIDMIYYHHEHHNGSGFPENLAGRRIPLGARILHVVDAFDAMTSGRPYQPNRTLRAATEELRRCAGRDFDPQVVGAFERALKKGRIKVYGVDGEINAEEPKQAPALDSLIPSTLGSASGERSVVGGSRPDSSRRGSPTGEQSA